MKKQLRGPAIGCFVGILHAIAIALVHNWIAGGGRNQLNQLNQLLLIIESVFLIALSTMMGSGIEEIHDTDPRQSEDGN